MILVGAAPVITVVDGRNNGFNYCTSADLISVYTKSTLYILVLGRKYENCKTGVPNSPVHGPVLVDILLGTGLHKQAKLHLHMCEI